MSEKLCKPCGIVKPFNEFNKQSKTKDGLQTDCKSCQSKRYRDRLEHNRERMRKYWPQYAESNRDRLNEKNKAYRASHKEHDAEYRASYIEMFPAKIAAKTAVWAALLTGKIKKSPCEICGNETVDGHHDDYSKPLEVRWLCRQHHAEWHSQNGEGSNGRAIEDALEEANA